LRQKLDDKRLTLPVSQLDHRWGPLSAEVTLVEYGDYACARSRQAYASIKANRQRLGDRFCFVFRNFPISQIHAQAQHAAEGGGSGGERRTDSGEMHDALFANQQALENGFLVEYASGLGLDTSWFLRDMSSHAHAERVEEDFKSGRQSGVESTPSFFINGVRHDDPWDEETLLAAVKQAAASTPTREEKD